MIRIYWADWFVLLCLGALGGLPQEFIEPVHQSLPPTDPDFQWAQVKPVQVPELILVTTYGAAIFALIFLIEISPVFFGGEVFTRRFHHALLGWFFALAGELFIQGILSILSGGLRPDFFAVCQPNLTNWEIGGVPECQNPSSSDIENSRRGFPCGHCSFSMANGLFFTLYLVGLLDPWDGNSSVLKQAVTMAPAVGAIFISITRWADAQHTLTAVGVGMLIGVVTALIAYHTFFHVLWSPLRGYPYAIRDREGIPASLRFPELFESPLPPRPRLCPFAVTWKSDSSVASHHVANEATVQQQEEGQENVDREGV